MALDLHLNTRPDEHGHFYLGLIPELIKTTEIKWLGFRRTVWKVYKQDGTPGRFTSLWFFGKLQMYHGDAKVDGSRTRNYWDGLLDDGKEPTPYIPDPTRYVYTDLPKEMYAFRWRTKGPGTVRWDTMGGS